MKITITFVDFIITMVVLFALQISVSKHHPAAGNRDWMVVSVNDGVLWVIGIDSRAFLAGGAYGMVGTSEVAQCTGSSIAPGRIATDAGLDYRDDVGLKVANAINQNVIVGTGAERDGVNWSIGIKDRTASTVFLLLAPAQDGGPLPLVKADFQDGAGRKDFTIVLDNDVLKAKLFQEKPSSSSAGTLIPVDQISSRVRVDRVNCVSAAERHTLALLTIKA